MEGKQKRKFRHSSSFYRKVKSELNRISSNRNPNSLKKVLNNSDNVNVISVKPSLANLVEASNIQPTISVYSDNNISNNSLDADVSEEISIENIHQSEHNFIPEIDRDDEEEENKIEAEISFNNNLRSWCLKYRIKHQAMNELLEILRSRGHNSLPKDSRTFLKTIQKTEIVTMGNNGEFWYYGVSRCLTEALRNIQKSISISLIFNIDGLPPFKSAPVEFWPILLRIAEVDKMRPMAVAIYCGHGKPPLQDFFAQFVNEMLQILNNGIECNGYKISVNIKYFVCDTPARNYIKGTIGFNGAHSCIKCTTVGKYDKIGRHMSFPNIRATKRTDASFRLKTDTAHHKEDSPLIKLPIHMIDCFIIADSLHLIDLGVMKKCLNGWIYGGYNFRRYKLSATQLELMSEALLKCNNTKPVEIHRAIRKLKHLKFWKGSEYRTFILYVGPVVLKSFLSKEVYEHFLQLFCAVTIVSCDTFSNYLHVAEELFKDYINNYSRIYGKDAISSNIHNICHITDDVRHFGNLTDISAYTFENFLGQIKLLLRNGNRPLGQIIRRLSELRLLEHSELKDQNSAPFVSSESTISHELEYCEKVFSRVYIPLKFMLSNNSKNKWFLTKSNEIVAMINATYFEKEIHIYGAKAKTKLEFFEKPIKSSYLNIYSSDLKLASPKLYNLNKIKCKLFAVEYKNKNMIFFPLLHTYL